MKYSSSYLFISLIFIGVLSVMSKQVYAVDVVVHVENIDLSKAGNIIVMLYGKEGFPKDHAKAIKVNVIPATRKKIMVNFISVPTEFAIKVLHDEDETGEVTKNWTGFIPAEGLGFSNNAKLSFGPPNFNRAKVELEDTNSQITINIIYP